MDVKKAHFFSQNGCEKSKTFLKENCKKNPTSLKLCRGKLTQTPQVSEITPFLFLIGPSPPEVPEGEIPIKVGKGVCVFEGEPKLTSSPEFHVNERCCEHFFSDENTGRMK